MYGDLRTTVAISRQYWASYLPDKHSEDPVFHDF